MNRIIPKYIIFNKCQRLRINSDLYKDLPFWKFNIKYEDIKNPELKETYKTPKNILDKVFNNIDMSCIYLNLNIRQSFELFDKIKKCSYYIYENDIMKYYTRFSIQCEYDKYNRLSTIKYKYYLNKKIDEIKLY